MTALRHCPFCGYHSPAPTEGIPGQYRVHCARCDCFGPTRDTPSDAVDYWNMEGVTMGADPSVATAALCEHAVIEAAKAAKESLYWAENAGLYWPRPGLLELRQAVEALIAAEQEGE